MTLQSAITDNEGFAFSITPKPGMTLDLRNAEFQFTWNREQYHTTRNVAVFSSIGGFSADQQIFTTSNTPGMGAVTTTIFRLPETPAYAGLTAPVEFRLYLFGSQYAHIGQFHGVKLTRDVTSSTTYQYWATGIPWNGADSTSIGDANGDGMPNLLAYGLVLDPRAPAPADTIPTAIPQGDVLDFLYRKNPRAGDLTYTVRRSADLERWSDLVIDGTIITETNIGMQGDAQLIRVRIPMAPDETRSFLQLHVALPPDP